MESTSNAPLRGAGITLKVRGRITSCVCRTTRSGAPVLEALMEDIGTGQVVALTHHYPNAGAASAIAAHALASRLRGQVVQANATNPRFKAKRLECEADFFDPTPEQGRARQDIDA